MSKEANNWMGCYEGGWRGLIVPEAYQHPAKFSYNLTERMIGHAIRNKWITKGSVVVDPFGGVGCGGIVAAYSDMVWIGCELELKFVDLAGQNFEMHRRKWEKLGCPQPVIVQGDSRRLCEVLSEADIVISSPPYEGARIGGVETMRRSTDVEGDYGTTEGQLGAMPPGNVDMVVSSPPYAEALSARGGRQMAQMGLGNAKAGKEDPCKDAIGYGQTPGNLGNLKPGDVEAIISSPPYEGIEIATGTASQAGIADRKKRRSNGTWEGYNKANPDNLGSSKGPTFWHAAREIVRQCHQILKPGGHAIWVTKRFVRKGQIVQFTQDWIRLCESVGFEVICCHKAMLKKVTKNTSLFGGDIVKEVHRKSFFRRLAESKGSPPIDWEDITCMRKK